MTDRVGVPLIPGSASDEKLRAVYQSGKADPLTMQGADGEVVTLLAYAVCYARISRPGSVTYWFRDARAK